MLEPLAVQVRVGVHEPGDDDGAAEIDDAGVTIPPGLHLATPAEGEDPAAADGQRRRGRPPGVERDDPAVVEDEGSGYFIQPFSR